MIEVNLAKEAALKGQRCWSTNLKVGFEFASVIDSLLNLGQVSVLICFLFGICFPIAELKNWPKAGEEMERSPCFLVEF